MTPGLRVVDAKGTPRALGRAHGEHLRDDIARGIDGWFAVIERTTRTSPRLYVDSFLAGTTFTDAISMFAPSLLKEIRGIADGARQPFETMLAYQLMDEEWAHRTSMVRSRRASVEACSAVGIVREGGSTIVAQNMDLPGHYDGTQVVLRLRPQDGPEVMVFAPAGMLGTCGLNASAVGICANAVPQLRHRSEGLPVGFVMRRMLAQPSVDRAVAFLHAAPHATGQNYMIGGPGLLRDFEASPGQVCELQREGPQLAHTNHPLASDDLDPDAPDDDDTSTSGARLERVRRLEAKGADVAPQDVMGVLSDREVPVCVPRGPGSMTLGSLVMELADDPVLHIAPGPPADTPYSELRFS